VSELVTVGWVGSGLNDNREDGRRKEETGLLYTVFGLGNLPSYLGTYLHCSQLSMVVFFMLTLFLCRAYSRHDDAQPRLVRPSVRPSVHTRQHIAQPIKTALDTYPPR